MSCNSALQKLQFGNDSTNLDNLPEPLYTGMVSPLQFVEPDVASVASPVVHIDFRTSRDEQLQLLQSGRRRCERQGRPWHRLGLGYSTL